MFEQVCLNVEKHKTMLKACVKRGAFIRGSRRAPTPFAAVPLSAKHDTEPDVQCTTSHDNGHKKENNYRVLLHINTLNNMTTQRQERNGAASQSLRRRLHVVFVVDSTGSMAVYLEALKRSLGQVNALLEVMFPSSADVSIYSYKDYSDGDQRLTSIGPAKRAQLLRFCDGLHPAGGGDMAEASKTALNAVLWRLRRLRQQQKKTGEDSGDDENDDTTIVFHYTDAPPHHKKTNAHGMNIGREIKALEGTKPGFDWCKICKRFRRLKQKNRVHLFTIVPKSAPGGSVVPHSLLCSET